MTGFELVFLNEAMIYPNLKVKAAVESFPFAVRRIFGERK